MEFVQIIVIIAVIGFYVARNMRREAVRDRKRNPARPVAVPPPAPADMPLPEREYREAEATISPPASVHIPARERPYERKRTSPEAAARPKPQPAEPRGETIRLDTAEEARRAFIYSEIFRRKYE